MSKRKRRPQSGKFRDPNFDRVLELRKGSRAQPIPSGKIYKRRGKQR
jgi:hypothetical protein